MATIVRETLPVVDAIQAKIDADQLSVRQVATELGVSPGSISNWLRGVYPPTLSGDSQQRLASFLGVSPRRVVELFEIDLRDDTGGYFVPAAA